MFTHHHETAEEKNWTVMRTDSRGGTEKRILARGRPSEEKKN